MEMIKEKTKFEGFLAFILGLSVCEGISVLISFGSTMLTVSEVISPLIMVLLMITRENRFFDFFRNIPLGFKLFFAVIAFSILPGMLFFGWGAIYRYAVGMIYFIIVLSMAINVYALRNSRDSLFLGIAVGLTLNLIFSLICYISFNVGTVISLEGVFPRDHFFTPTLAFRAQGFFLEPSHLLRFIASVILIVMVNVNVKSLLFKYLWVILAFFVVLYSTSGSVVILLLGLLMYWMIHKKERKKAITITSLIVFLFVIVLGAFLLFTPGVLSDIWSNFSKILLGADITDEGNAARFESMKTVLEHMDIAAIGCGWNLIGTYFETQNLGIVSAFSFILQMTVELGFLGALMYCLALFTTSYKLIKQKNDKAIALGITLIIIFALQVGTDYSFNTCTMAVFGLVVCELEEIRNKNRIYTNKVGE